ncbi:caspase-14-like [Anopheles aquasalis]|uniref:caspase-14-like n=1 Tax=Anopheles aquasalis TaxID=42839 RepID=UPI00215A8EF8|nr:caspase-14-like [Anopheles aquasalis]
MNTHVVNEPIEFNTHDIAEPSRNSSNQTSGSTTNSSTNSSGAISPREEYVDNSAHREENVVSGSRREVPLEKYDLRKNAYVLVLHHYMFRDSTHNREGSEKDMAKIERFFRDYRADQLNVKENQTAADVRSIMDGFLHHNFTNNSCLIIIIMSHGVESDRIEAYDGETYCFEADIVEKCTLNRSLDGKPKLFIVQACRGDSTMTTDSKKTQSKKSDVLTFQSTYKGFFAYRHEQNGSVFIQNFFKLLDQHRDEDICHINQHLNNVFERERIPQNPTMTSTLKKRLIFGDLRRA